MPSKLASEGDQWAGIAKQASEWAKTHDMLITQKLLIIVIIFKHWCHYLKDSYQIIEILTDHNNLQEFIKVKELNERQA